MKNKSLFICVFISSIFLFGAGTDSVPNLYSPRYLVFTAGQPDLFGMNELSAMGIKSVINVLPEEECLPGEPAMVISNKMEYFALPFDPAKLDMQLVHSFAELFSTAPRPVLIHCSTGNHVGGLWFAYRVLYENATLAQAIKEARKIGMKPSMEDAVLDFIAKNKTTLAS